MCFGRKGNKEAILGVINKCLLIFYDIKDVKDGLAMKYVRMRNFGQLKKGQHIRCFILYFARSLKMIYIFM